MYQNKEPADVRPSNPTLFEKPMKVPPGCFLRRPFHFRRGVGGRRMPVPSFRPFPRQQQYRSNFIPTEHAIQNSGIRSFPPRYNLMDPRTAARPQFPSPNRPRQMVENNMYRHPVPGTTSGCFPHPETNLPSNNSVQPSEGNSDELWIETQTPTGKPYYYNARTRETVWRKPENANVLSQNQIRKLTETIGVPNTGSSPKDQPPPKENTQPSAEPAPGQFLAPQNTMVGLRPISPSNLIMFPPPTFAMPPQLLQGFPQLPPFPLNFPTMYPPFVPQIAESVPSAEPNLPPEIAPEEAISENKPKKHETKHQEDTVEVAEEWSEHLTTTGEKYYYNKAKKISLWNKPECLSKLTSNVAKDLDKVDVTQPLSVKTDVSDEGAMYSPSSCQAGSPMEIETADRNFEIGLFQVSVAADVKEIPTSVGVTPVQKEAEKQVKVEESEVDKSRPVSSTPVPGTPWCIVWTGDSKVFFYNPNLCLSVWERPYELQGRADVDKLIQFQPMKPELVVAPEPEIKKIKVNNTNNQKTSEVDGKLSPNKDDCNKDCENAVSKTYEPIACGKESASEAEAIAAKKRASIPLDIRMKTFRELLDEKNVSAFSTWEKELYKIVFDPRYLLLSFRERRQVFDSYVKEKADSEKNERRSKLREQKQTFNGLLREVVLSPRTRFSEFAQAYGKDDRFKVIEKMRDKEDLFNHFLHDLRRKDYVTSSSLNDNSRFIELLKERKDVDEHSKWSEISKKLSNDERFRNVSDEILREKLFKNYIRGMVGDTAAKAREKRDRIKASIRDREEEVKRALSLQMKELDKEREIHKRAENVQRFRALLTDLIRDSETSWHNAKKVMKKDRRFDSVRFLEKKERDKIFDDHIEALNQKRKMQFRELLDDIPEITLTSIWAEVKNLVTSDHRCEKFSKSERKCEKEFNNYMEYKLAEAKEDFNELLKETKIITYKSKTLMEQLDHLGDIEKALQNDKRYLVLEFMEEERRDILIAYIDALHDKGPPPPPTASDPDRR